MSLWWLSFRDPGLPEDSGFTGACVVEADGFMDAVRTANCLNLNPGGHGIGKQVPISMIPFVGAEWRERLLTRQESVLFERELERHGVS